MRLNRESENLVKQFNLDRDRLVSILDKEEKAFFIENNIVVFNKDEFCPFWEIPTNVRWDLKKFELNNAFQNTWNILECIVLNPNQDFLLGFYSRQLGFSPSKPAKCLAMGFGRAEEISSEEFLMWKWWLVSHNYKATEPQDWLSWRGFWAPTWSDPTWDDL
jgi:hypothetical protein